LFPFSDNWSPVTDFHRVDDADHGGVDGAVLALKGHSRRAALNYQDNFVKACAYRVYGNKMPLLILTVDADQAGDKQLAPVQAFVLASRNNSPDYSS
jgi:hypothetical protein